ncbi:uncharacterized protein TNCV_1623531 [Trichonephila clavipes]|nr:uncharacterized protein TNCV_1623531 [Trichonephila clavipes]
MVEPLRGCTPKRHPVRRTPAHTMFARLHQQLCETASFQKAARPYILPDRLTGPRYLIFLEQVLPELLDSAHVTAATRTSMWFQQDGAPAHFSISVRNHVDATCGER